MSLDPEAVGTLDTAIAHTRRLLAQNPALAEQQAQAILEAVPDHPIALLLLGSARRATGCAAHALGPLQQVIALQPSWAAAHLELGLALGEANHFESSLQALRRALELKPTLSAAWQAIGDQLTIAGDSLGADYAYAQHIKTSVSDPRLMTAAAALCDNEIPRAELLLRRHLRESSNDVAALRMLAEVAARLGRYQDAETLLARCLELAPSFAGARYNYALVLHRQNKPAAALQQIAMLEAQEPYNPGFRNLKAVILARIGEFQESLRLYEEILALQGGSPAIWLSYGHALASAGREADGIAAYRRCIELAPRFGEAYWSLANLKIFSFSAAEVTTMERERARTDLKDEERFHFDFALGKACEDAGRFESAFLHYDAANSLRRRGLDYNAEDTSVHVKRCKELFNRDFFESRRHFGASARDPIFIVGLPRAGSTLIEQILASHSAVEGTMELPNIISMARRLSGKTRKSDFSSYPEVLAGMSAQDSVALGEEYIAKTRIQRKTDRPFFIDKMPNNFLHVGLIRMILPNARIIDARRHPMACCFSNFKQHFAKGQVYTYDLTELGRYYRDYVDLMQHFDQVQPDAVYRVSYEQMIEDTAGEISRLLAFCGLEAEVACLRFYDNERAVRTASAQQVRRPIFRDGLDQWRNFEPWLAPLKESLGPIAMSYPHGALDKLDPASRS